MHSRQSPYGHRSSGLIQNGIEGKRCVAEIVYLLVIALHYRHLRGVIFFFVEEVVYRCSVAAGPEAETIVIQKVPSVSFGLNGVPRKT